MKLTQLKAIAKENKVVGRSIMNKPEYVAALEEKGLIIEENIRKVQPTESHSDSRYDDLKLLRRNPKRVIVADAITGEVVEYPSLYKAGSAIGVNSKRLLVNADKTLDERFKKTIPIT